MVAIVGEAREAGLPPYIASLIVSEDMPAADPAEGKEFIQTVFHSLRPYGGVAYLPVRPGRAPVIERWVADARLSDARVRRSGDFMALSRDGALRGSDTWTHEHANAANTIASRDTLVKAPLGVLWFGGPSSRQAISHIKGASITPRIAGGRMYVEGDNMLHAFDAYTGRMLWKVTFSDRTKSQKTHLVCAEDAVYLVDGAELLALDARTGNTLKGFQFTDEDQWGAFKVWEEYLIVPGAKRLLVADRRTGEVLWKREGASPLATAVGGLHCAYREAPDFARHFLERKS